MERRIERLDKYLKDRGISSNRLEIESGISKGTLSKARSGKTDIGATNIVKVLEKFTDINEVWLLTGEGEMLKPTTPVASNTNNAPVAGNLTQTATATAPTPPENPQVKIENERLRAENALLKEQNDKLLAIIAAKNI